VGFHAGAARRRGGAIGEDRFDVDVQDRQRLLTAHVTRVDVLEAIKCTLAGH